MKKRIKLLSFFSEFFIRLFQIVFAALVIGTMVKSGSSSFNLIFGGLLCLLSLILGTACYILYLSKEEQQHVG